MPLSIILVVDDQPINVQLQSSVARFKQDNLARATVIVENSHTDLLIETNTEIFEDFMGKVLMNARESYGNLPEASRPIWIRTELVEKRAEGKAVQFKIEDQGQGVSPEIRDHVFEPFNSYKSTVGVGMCLTVARHALRGLGGEVTLTDRSGGGTGTLLIHPIEKRVRKNEDE